MVHIKKLLKQLFLVCFPAGLTRIVLSHTLRKEEFVLWRRSRVQLDYGL